MNRNNAKKPTMISFHTVRQWKRWRVAYNTRRKLIYEVPPQSLTPEGNSPIKFSKILSKSQYSSGNRSKDRKDLTPTPEQLWTNISSNTHSHSKIGLDTSPSSPNRSFIQKRQPRFSLIESARKNLKMIFTTQKKLDDLYKETSTLSIKEMIDLCKARCEVQNLLLKFIVIGKKHSGMGRAC